jgi:hypothetical protein
MANESEKQVEENQWKATASLANAINRLADTVDRLANIVSSVEARIGSGRDEPSIAGSIASGSVLEGVRPR